MMLRLPSWTSPCSLAYCLPFAIVAWLTLQPCHAGEIFEHSIASENITGNPDTDGWYGVARNTTTGRTFRLDNWNASLKRWEPKFLPTSLATDVFHAGARSQLPFSGFDTTRVWLYRGNKPVEAQITGFLQLREPGETTNGIVGTIERLRADGTIERLWGGPNSIRATITGSGSNSHNFRATIQPREALLFTVNARGDHTGDLTRWPVDIALAPAPIESAVANKGFYLTPDPPEGNNWKFTARNTINGRRVELIPNPGGWWEMPEPFNESLLRMYPDGVHPGIQWDAVRSWTYTGNHPREVRIVGAARLTQLEKNNHDGATVEILKSTRNRLGEPEQELLWKRRIDGRTRGANYFSDHHLITTMLPGDRLEFISGSGGDTNANFDHMIWFPSIATYEPVKRHEGSTNTEIEIGRRETAVSRSERNFRELEFWPDGPFGWLREMDGSLTFYASNSALVAQTKGTLRDPVREVINPSFQINNMPPGIDYQSGGPIFVPEEEEVRDMVLLFYHAEEYLNGDPTTFYARIGLAIRRPNGSFDNLGFIFEPEYTGDDQTANLWSGSYTLHRDPADGILYFYLYTADTLADGSSVALTAARSPYRDVLLAARAGTVSNWYKYYCPPGGQGGFTQPAMGHYPSTSLFPSRPAPASCSVSYNHYLERHLMAVCLVDELVFAIVNTNVHFFTSEDGIHWESMGRIEDEAYESSYCTLVGTEDRQWKTGRSFYVYFNRSIQGGNHGFARWKDAELGRRRIRLTRLAPAFSIEED